MNSEPLKSLVLTLNTLGENVTSQASLYWWECGGPFDVGTDSTNPNKCWDYSHRFEQIGRSPVKLLLTEVVTLILCVRNERNDTWSISYLKRKMIFIEKQCSHMLPSPNGYDDLNFKVPS